MNDVYLIQRKRKDLQDKLAYGALKAVAPKAERADVRNAAAWIFRLTSGLTFYYDEWDFVAQRRGGLSAALEPHNQHIVLVPYLLYEALFHVVGLAHYWPYRLMIIAVHVGIAVALFAYARRRTDPVLAVTPPVILLFLGPFCSRCLSQWRRLLIRLSFIVILERLESRSFLSLSTKLIFRIIDDQPEGPCSLFCEIFPRFVPQGESDLKVQGGPRLLRHCAEGTVGADGRII